MGAASHWHWLIILLVLILLFGRNVISNTMADVGRGIRHLRSISREGNDGEI
jgi:TatA/E family protein of Tat protein translocase